MSRGGTLRSIGTAIRVSSGDRMAGGSGIDARSYVNEVRFGADT
jgi:hypothetical protein